MFALTGLGFGPPQGLLLAVAQLAVDPEFSGLASAHVIGIRSMGGTIGAAIASGIFTAKITSKLPVTIAMYAAAAGVPADKLTAVVGAVATAAGGAVSVPGKQIHLTSLQWGPEYLLCQPGVTAAQIEAAQQGRLQAFAESFAFIFWSILPWAVAGAIGKRVAGDCQAVADTDENRREFTSHVLPQIC